MPGIEDLEALKDHVSKSLERVEKIFFDINARMDLDRSPCDKIQNHAFYSTATRSFIDSLSITRSGGEDIQKSERQDNVTNQPISPCLQLDFGSLLAFSGIGLVLFDRSLHVRFAAASASGLASLIPTSGHEAIGALALAMIDRHLTADARSVLGDGIVIEREIEVGDGHWFHRVLAPYHTSIGVDGVVLTLIDISNQHQISEALAAANTAVRRSEDLRSRFLTSAGRELRQPLQSIRLVQGLLQNTAQGSGVSRLLARLDAAVSTMDALLGSLEDLDQLESQAIRPMVEEFSISELFDQLKDEFEPAIAAANLELRVIPTRCRVRSDRRLLARMIRNILSNAVKYTRFGRILMGCRRVDGMIRVEVWDTGLGIAETSRDAIFEDFRKMPNTGGVGPGGLGLGLAIVQRLSTLLGHSVGVRSRLGRGSAFSILVPGGAEGETATAVTRLLTEEPSPATKREGTVLVIAQDREIRETIELTLESVGYCALAFGESQEALNTRCWPDLIVCDQYLSNGVSGAELVARLRRKLQRLIPAVVMVDNEAAVASFSVLKNNIAALKTPIAGPRLIAALDEMLAGERDTPRGDGVGAPERSVAVIDPEHSMRGFLLHALASEGYRVTVLNDVDEYLADDCHRDDCLILDVDRQGRACLEGVTQLKKAGVLTPIIVVSGHADVGLAVRAMKDGASDIAEKPLTHHEIMVAVRRAVDNPPPEPSAQSASATTPAIDTSKLGHLTPRQRQILDMVLAGQPSKNIAADLSISQRTVEAHRAAIMRKMGSRSLPMLVRIVLGDGEPIEVPKPAVARSRRWPAGADEDVSARTGL
jgi:two-component system CheB/CheR fusion protein